MALLKAGERLIMEGAASESMQTNAKGTLTLTNHKITFEKVEGLISKKKNIEFEVPLSSIANIGVEGLISKKLVIEISWSGTLKKYQFSLSDAKEWDASIRSAIQQS
jgi:hypothetical protein